MTMNDLCYMVSVSSMKEILAAQSTEHTRYKVITGEDMVTVIHYGVTGVLHQVAFPIAYQIPEIEEDEGTMVLMVATERAREWSNFWIPMEKRLTHCSTMSPA
ncbi:MAG TPA: hypothetical protein VHN74_09125 [Candidatus Angelobacter sp.]|jgi:hypothetical protein|nr:hypothetical protein [Candidatus Angelobacter sp.]